MLKVKRIDDILVSLEYLLLIVFINRNELYYIL